MHAIACRAPQLRTVGSLPVRKLRATTFPASVHSTYTPCITFTTCWRERCGREVCLQLFFDSFKGREGSFKVKTIVGETSNVNDEEIVGRG